MFFTETDEVTCKLTDRVRFAMDLINCGSKVVFIVDNDQVLCGILTDGDIRRFLLDGGELSDPVSLCMNTGFSYYIYDSGMDIPYDADKGISIVPVVDNKMHLCGYYKVDTISVPIASPQINGNELKYLTDAFLSTWISSKGEYIGRFEETFSSYCGKTYGVSSSNGTTALHLALMALGIKDGDEVIVPELTFAATINAVLYVGAVPVVVDVEEDSWCIDPNCIRKAITTKTKAIIPVHVYGQPCDMNSIMDIAKTYNLFVIEDCAEAHGAEVEGKKVGSFGDIGCFSFFANKVITTGEGGMCITDSPELAERMKLLRDHGMSKNRRYYHEIVGYNYRMTNLQAAIGTAQLERIDEMLFWRKKIEEQYYRCLTDFNNIVLQKDIANRKRIVWLVSVLIPQNKKQRVQEKLREIGVDLRFFFVPLTDMPIYSKYRFDTNPVSRMLSDNGINLPTSFGISRYKIEQICDEIIGIVERG